MSSLGAPPGEGCVQVRGSRSELGWLGWSGDGGVTRFGMAVGVPVGCLAMLLGGLSILLMPLLPSSVAAPGGFPAALRRSRLWRCGSRGVLECSSGGVCCGCSRSRSWHVPCSRVSVSQVRRVRRLASHGEREGSLCGVRDGGCVVASTWVLVGLSHHSLLQAGPRRARVCLIPSWLFGCSLRLGQASSFVFLYSF